MIGFEEIVEEFKVNFGSVVEVNDGGYELGFEEGIEHAKSTLTEKEITANGEYVPQGDSLGFNKVIVNVPDINGSYDNGFTDGQLDGYNNALEKLTELEVNGNGEYLPSGESIGFKKVIATGYLDTTDATATPEKILDGFTAYVNNEKIEGTIPKYTGESENAEIKTSKLASLVDGSLTEVTEKDLAGVTSIRQYAFYYAPITSVDIPNTVTSIGMYAFGYCSNLISVAIPNSVTNINSHTFYDCGKLENVLLSNNITSIGLYAFYSCESLKSINIPDTVKIIQDNSFSYCVSLTSIAIGNSVTSIGGSAFQNCGLTTITIPASVTSIGERAFYSCGSLASVNFGENAQLTKIKKSTFTSCGKLTSIDIPNTVTEIAMEAFYSCSSLTSLTIPASVTTIGSSALRIGSTNNKATIRMLPRTNGETPPSLQSSSINTSTLQAIEIPENEISAYSSATQWSNLTSYFVPYQPHQP